LFRYGIKSIINLQHPDEHASCGLGVRESGFSYEPEEFMQAESENFVFNLKTLYLGSVESILEWPEGLFVNMAIGLCRT
jgi:protein tyrosine phosphatase domain-containing protein 1